MNWTQKSTYTLALLVLHSIFAFAAPVYMNSEAYKQGVEDARNNVNRQELPYKGRALSEYHAGRRSVLRKHAIKKGIKKGQVKQPVRMTGMLSPEEQAELDNPATSENRVVEFEQFD